MTINLIDRALFQLAPTALARRMAARAQIAAISASSPGAGGSSGGNGAGSRHWFPFARDAAGDTLRNLPLQRAASRELARTNAIAAGAIGTTVDRVVGTGLAFVATPAGSILRWSADQAAEWKATTQAEFALWSDDPAACDVTGEQTFYQAQATVLRGVKESGDAFTLLPSVQRTRMNPYGLRFQLLEADRVGNPAGEFDTPTMAGGIRFDAAGRPTAAHLYSQHPGAISIHSANNRLAGQWIEYTGQSGRRRLLHHYIKQRPGQPRGIPYLAPVVDIIKQLGRFTDAEVNAAVLNSYYTMFVTRDARAGSPVHGTENAQPAGDGDISIGQGTLVELTPGEKIEFADPKRPNPNAEAFVHALIGLIGMALGIPREVLLKQFNSSFSASKAALLDAWVRFRAERMWLGLSFCQPIYETWLAEAVFMGRVQAPGFFTDPLLRWAYTRAAWPGDSMGSINPKDEVAAYTAAIDARLMSRERAEWELFGTDWNATFEQKLAEHQRMAGADLLPVPKAGAAAPQNTRPEDTTP